MLHEERKGWGTEALPGAIEQAPLASDAECGPAMVRDIHHHRRAAWRPTVTDYDFCQDFTPLGQLHKQLGNALRQGALEFPKDVEARVLEQRRVGVHASVFCLGVLDSVYDPKIQRPAELHGG